jgi:hypothetical protein
LSDNVVMALAIACDSAGRDGYAVRYVIGILTLQDVSYSD